MSTPFDLYELAVGPRGVSLSWHALARLSTARLPWMGNTKPPGLGLYLLGALGVAAGAVVLFTTQRHGESTGGGIDLGVGNDRTPVRRPFDPKPQPLSVQVCPSRSTIGRDRPFAPFHKHALHP